MKHTHIRIDSTLISQRPMAMTRKCAKHERHRSFGSQDIWQRDGQTDTTDCFTLPAKGGR